MDKLVMSKRFPELTPKNGTARISENNEKISSEVNATNMVIPSWATGKSSLKAFLSMRIKMNNFAKSNDISGKMQGDQTRSWK